LNTGNYEYGLPQHYSMGESTAFWRIPSARNMA